MKLVLGAFLTSYFHYAANIGSGVYLDAWSKNSIIITIIMGS